MTSHRLPTSMLRSFQALRDPHWSGIIPARPEVVQGRIGTLGAVPSWLSHKNVCSPEGDSEGRVARPSNVLCRTCAVDLAEF